MGSNAYQTETLAPREFEAAMDYRDAVARLLDRRPDLVFSVHLTRHAITVTTTGPGMPVITTYTRKDSA